MANDKGWIKLNRQITEHWIFEDPERFRAWVDLLLMVNHEGKKVLVDGQPTLIKRGQVLTSICKLSKRWGWSRKKTHNFILALERDGMVERKSTSRYTTLTLVNYGKYQDGGTSKGTTQGTGKGASREQVRVHKQECIKNDKEIKEEELDLTSNEEVGSQEEEDPDAWWKEIEEAENEEGDI